MTKYFSPANLIVATGVVLAFVGMTAYFTDSVNLSVPTFFYGVPILLIGLRWEIDNTAKQMMEQNPHLPKLEAYVHAYNKWIK